MKSVLKYKIYGRKKETVALKTHKNCTKDCCAKMYMLLENQQNKRTRSHNHKLVILSISVPIGKPSKYRTNHPSG